MALPAKAHFSIDEAAIFVKKATQERVNTAQVIDWAAQGFFSMYVITNNRNSTLTSARAHVRCEGSQDIVECNGELIRFIPDAGQVKMLESGYFIEILCGFFHEKKCTFMEKKNAHSWSEVACPFKVGSVLIEGSGLELFVANHVKPVMADAQSKAFIESDVDPSELPIELDAANMAYRAVFKGYGEKSNTFKSRLMHYLNANYPSLKAEAVKRIATVANPDKSAGRKKREK